jgi:transporter family protein
MRTGLLYAILGAISSALWTTFHNQAASKINPLVGAGIVSVVATVIAFGFAYARYQPGMFSINKTGLFFIVLVGIAAFACDYFALKTFATDLPLSVGGPILLGGSIALVTLIGFLLGETVTWQIALGIVLVTSGSVLLSRVG